MEPTALCTYPILQFYYPLLHVQNILKPYAEFLAFKVPVCIVPVSTYTYKRFMVRRKIVSESSFDLVVIRRAKFFNSSQLSLCIEEEFRMEFVG